MKGFILLAILTSSCTEVIYTKITKDEINNPEFIEKKIKIETNESDNNFIRLYGADSTMIIGRWKQQMFVYKFDEIKSVQVNALEMGQENMCRQGIMDCEKYHKTGGKFALSLIGGIFGYAAVTAIDTKFPDPDLISQDKLESTEFLRCYGEKARGMDKSAAGNGLIVNTIIWFTLIGTGVIPLHLSMGYSR